jgi:hypothetical protein
VALSFLPRDNPYGIKNPTHEREKLSKYSKCETQKSTDTLTDHRKIFIADNVPAYCRSCCISTLYQREPARENSKIFIPRGKAAILAICSLAVRAF